MLLSCYLITNFIITLSKEHKAIAEWILIDNKNKPVSVQEFLQFIIKTVSLSLCTTPGNDESV